MGVQNVRRRSLVPVQRLGAGQSLFPRLARGNALQKTAHSAWAAGTLFVTLRILRTEDDCPADSGEDNRGERRVAGTHDDWEFVPV